METKITIPETTFNKGLSFTRFPTQGTVKVKGKVKLSLYQAMEAHRVVRR
jgi:hypothetical protein